jgi:energy-coupling factor transporter ATP-binding protein EcfA2
VTQGYRIAVRWLHPEGFEHPGSMRLGGESIEEPEVQVIDKPRFPVHFELISTEGAALRVDQAGSGIATWALFALERALFELQHDTVVRFVEGECRIERLGALTAAARRQLYVIDEPERHLHPLAQADVARFLTGLARSGADVVVATHSPTLLNVPYADTVYLRVTREDGITRVADISGDVLKQLDRAAESLGLLRADLLQLTRAALIVEGKQDRKVLEALYGKELSAARVRILSLSGADNTLALLDAELLRSLGLPILVLLDHTRADTVRELAAGRRPSARLRKEERQLVQLMAGWESDRDGLTLLSFPWPDIICALPEIAVLTRDPRQARSQAS